MIKNYIYTPTIRFMPCNFQEARIEMSFDICLITCVNMVRLGHNSFCVAWLNLPDPTKSVMRVKKKMVFLMVKLGVG